MGTKRNSCCSIFFSIATSAGAVNVDLNDTVFVAFVLKVQGHQQLLGVLSLCLSGSLLNPKVGIDFVADVQGAEQRASQCIKINQTRTSRSRHGQQKANTQHTSAQWRRTAWLLLTIKQFSRVGPSSACNLARFSWGKLCSCTISLAARARWSSGTKSTESAALADRSPAAPNRAAACQHLGQPTLQQRRFKSMVGCRRKSSWARCHKTGCLRAEPTKYVSMQE